MQTLERLRHQINNAEDLRSIVRTMKVLAVTSIHQFEEAASASDRYLTTVELGLQALLKKRPDIRDTALKDAENGKVAFVVFGSGQGLCGRFNEQIVEFTLEQWQETHSEKLLVLALGDRVAGLLGDQGYRVAERFSLPGAVSGIARAVSRVLEVLDRWLEEEQLVGISLIFNASVRGTSYGPHLQRLLPIDRVMLGELRRRPWPTNQLPLFTMEPARLFARLVHHYLLVSLNRAFARSLAAEQASRLSAMQAAERKIEENIEVLTGRFRSRRQHEITEEVLDIMAGFEALTGTTI